MLVKTNPRPPTQYYHLLEYQWILEKKRGQNEATRELAGAGAAVPAMPVAVATHLRSRPDPSFGQNPDAGDP
jgi:hypothetical protein